MRKTIESLLDNTYPNKEIIVIDDHSTDDTFQQVYPYYNSGRIKLVKRSEGSKGSKSGDRVTKIHIKDVIKNDDINRILARENAIVDFCKSNPDGSIVNDLVNTSKISDFYAEYTCDDAAQEKSWLDGNQSSSTRITILH